MKLKHLHALITGGSQGLGKVIAEHFLREGAHVVLCARSEKELSATRAELAAKFPDQRVLAQTCDVANETQVNALVAFALKELGSLDALVLNAGIYGPMGPTETVSLEEWRRALDINLFGVLLPCRAIIPHFKSAKRGKIVVLSGGGATNPLPNISAYERVGAAFFEKNKTWKEKGAVPLELGASLAVWLASAESNGITGRLISAQWDPWKELSKYRDDLAKSDIYCLRRIVPEDRGKKW